MSANQRRPNGVAASAAFRDKSLLHLLDPGDLMPGHTTADLYSLRHLTLRGGLPDSPSWLRAQAWKVLLGYLPPEKKEWSTTLAKRRREYYHFLNDLSPPLDAPSSSSSSSSSLSDKDALLDQIYKDLSRSRKNGFAFYQATPRPSHSCPISPLPLDNSEDISSDHTQAGYKRSPVQRLQNRDNIIRRLALVNRDFAQHLLIERAAARDSKGKGKELPQILHLNQDVSDISQEDGADLSWTSSINDDSMKSPPILLSPPSPGGMSRESSQHSFSSAREALAESSAGHDADLEASSGLATPRPPPSTESENDDLLHRNWHSLVRILYLFALLNPSIGYVQGMNEALFTLLYVFGSATFPQRQEQLSSSDSQADLYTTKDGSITKLKEWDNDVDLSDLTSHAEADAFWCFSTLMAEMRELYEFDGIVQQSRSDAPSADNQHAKTGMAGALLRFSLRVKWLDHDLWKDLRLYHLDPRLPYYSLRWLACLLSTELSLPSVMRIWDALLAEQDQSSTVGSAKVEFLIDVSCAMLLNVKDSLPRSSDGIDEEQEAFSHGMRFLQSYPDDDINPILEMATLFRQRRLAAELTGDGPPLEDDEEETTAGVASVKARAAQALRSWTGTTSASSPMFASKSSPGTGPTTDQLGTPAKTGWFSSVGRSRNVAPLLDTPDASFSSDTNSTSVASTPSKASLSEMFSKYAEAVQSSDAAASLSKASTNLSARALARFGDRGSREATPETSSPTNGVLGATQGNRIASLGSISAGMFNRGRRTASASQSFSHGSDSPHTPDMTRWSRDTMPDFPLPNVSDSPAGRMEYVDTYGKRISVVHGRVGPVPGSPAISEAQSEGGASFPLPSLRAAAKLGILPPRNRDGSVSPNGRSVGPKPLLLSQSARPPRDGSPLLLREEPSRKVSSGPMAHSMSRGNSNQDGRSSVAGSTSGRSSRSVSAAGSRASSAGGSPDTSMSALQQADAFPPLPSLTGQSAAAALPAPSSALSSLENERSTSQPSPMGPVSLSGTTTKDGIVKAGAFSRAAKSTTGDSATSQRPEFGHIASSSDIPLIQPGSTSISRPRAANRKRLSSSTIGSRTASTSGSLSGTRLSNRTSRTTVNGTDVMDPNEILGAEMEGMHLAEASAIVSEEPDSFEQECRPDPDFDSTTRFRTKREWSVGEAVQLQDAPMPMLTQDEVDDLRRSNATPLATNGARSSAESPSTTSASQPFVADTVQRYTLSDEPMVEAESIPDQGQVRRGSAISRSSHDGTSRALRQARQGSSVARSARELNVSSQVQ